MEQLMADFTVITPQTLNSSLDRIGSMEYKLSEMRLILLQAGYKRDHALAQALSEYIHESPDQGKEIIDSLRTTVPASLFKLIQPGRTIN